MGACWEVEKLEQQHTGDRPQAEAYVSTDTLCGDGRECTLLRRAHFQNWGQFRHANWHSTPFSTAPRALDQIVPLVTTEPFPCALCCRRSDSPQKLEGLGVLRGSAALLLLPQDLRKSTIGSPAWCNSSVLFSLSKPKLSPLHALPFSSHLSVLRSHLSSNSIEGARKNSERLKNESFGRLSLAAAGAQVQVISAQLFDLSRVRAAALRDTYIDPQLCFRVRRTDSHCQSQSEIFLRPFFSFRLLADNLCRNKVFRPCTVCATISWCHSAVALVCWNDQSQQMCKVFGQEARLPFLVCQFFPGTHFPQRQTETS